MMERPFNPPQRPTAPNDVSPPTLKTDLVHNIPLHHAGAAPAQAAAPAAHQPAPAKPAAKPVKPRRPIPYMAIFFALIVTAVLIAAAWAAYKK